MKKLFLIILLFTSAQAFCQLNISHYMEVGETRIQIGNYVGAIENFNIVIRFKPHLPEPYYFRGVAKHQLEDFRGAIRDYNIAIDIKPFYPDAYMHRGLAYLEMKDFANAIKDYNRAIELDPYNANIYNNRGIAKVSIKDIDGAIADYDKAIELNPKSTNAYINRSNARLMKNDIKGAIKDLNQTILIRPHYSSAYLLRGLARFELNDYASALRDFDQCIKLDPGNAGAFNNRGLIKQKLEDFRGAIVDYNMAIQLDPTQANAYMNRGISKEMLKLPGSSEDYAMAAKLDPKFAFNAKDVDYESLARAQKKANQSSNKGPAGNTKTTTSQPVAAANTTQQPAGQPTAPADSLANKPRKETPEERERRRLKLALADAQNTPTPKDKVIDDGRIQNKNIVIDLQPIFMLSSFDQYSSDYNRSQYYNIELESINNFNNYNPVISISNQLPGDQIEAFRNTILLCNERIKINNRESNNFLNRGIFYCLTNDYSESMNDLKKALELNNKNTLAYFAMGNCLLKMAEVVEQIKNNSSYLKVPIKNQKTTSTGTIVETNHDYAEILKNYTTCLTLNPKFPFAYYNQAYIKCKMRDYEGALSDLNKAIEMEDDFAEAYFNRGLTRIYLDDIEGGAMDLSKAGELGIQDAYNIIKRYCN